MTASPALAVADEVAEVHHLGRHGVVEGEVASREELAEVEAVVRHGPMVRAGRCAGPPGCSGPDLQCSGPGAPPAGGRRGTMRRSSVAGMFRANVADHGDDSHVPVPRDDGDVVRALRARPCVAGALLAEGVGAGDRVAMLDRNGLAYFEVLFGGALSGAVNVAVNWRLAPAEMAAVIDDSKATVLVVHPDFVPCLAAMESGLPCVRRVVVLGDPKARRGRRGRVGSRPPSGLRRLARRCLGHRPGLPGCARRRVDAALHVGHDGAAQRRDVGQPQHRRHAVGGRATPSRSARQR